jgi:hypothetical protein
MHFMVMIAGQLVVLFHFDLLRLVRDDKIMHRELSQIPNYFIERHVSSVPVNS